MSPKWVTTTVAVLALVMAGCAGPPTQHGAGTDTVVIALSDQPTNLNPIFGDLYGSIYGDHWPIFSSLLDYDQKLDLVPDLANAAPQVSPDGRTVTVTLRDGVSWHDGTPFTANDVVFTYRAFLDPAVATGLRDELYSTLASVDKVDYRTVRFGLSQVDPAFPDKLTLSIVPEHLLAGQDLNTAAFNLAPVGTGPYVFEELRPGERMTLRANPNYHGGTVAIQRVVFSFVPDENVRATRLRSGELDVDAVGLPPRVAGELAGTEGIKLVRIPGESTLLHLPHQNPLFADGAVRNAVNLALDRTAIAEGVFAGAGTPTATPIPAGHWADAADVPVPVRDVAAARAALDGAGWAVGPDGVRQRGDQRLQFNVGYSAGSAVSNNVGLAVRDQLAEVGMRVELEGLGFEAFSEQLAKGIPQINTQSIAYDPALEVSRRYHSAGIADTETFTNANQMNSPDADAATEAGGATADRPTRAAAYANLERAVAADASYLYLVEGKNSLVVRDRVQGVTPQAREGHIHGFSRGLLWNLHQWRLAG